MHKYALCTLDHYILYIRIKYHYFFSAIFNQRGNTTKQRVIQTLTTTTMADRSRREKKSKLEKFAEYKRAREGGGRVRKVGNASFRSWLSVESRV
jgi:hypothetical protein